MSAIPTRSVASESSIHITPVTLPTFPTNTVNLNDCGGLGDGKTLNTEAFEKGLKLLEKMGGGKLVVPPGFWMTGPIHLRSNIDFHLESGALVRFSTDPAQYPLVVTETHGEKRVDSTSPISGKELQNVAITGSGILDGGGDAWRPVKKTKLNEAEWAKLVAIGGVLSEDKKTWWPDRSALEGEKAVSELRSKGSLDPREYEPYHRFLRPRMLRLIGCRNVLIQGVTFRNPPNWTMNPSLCEDVSIISVHVINSSAAQNSDALDLESCRRALVKECTFDTGDDGICIKSGKDGEGRRIGMPTEDVLVEDCTVYHAHGGFVIGSEMSGGVRNILVRNCTFIGTSIGLRFKSKRGRGGIVENIQIEGVRMEDITEAAIDFNMYYGGKDPTEKEGLSEAPKAPQSSKDAPTFRDIRIHDLLCRGAGEAILIQGLPENPIRDITLKNVSIISDKGVTVKNAANITFEGVRLDCKIGAPLTSAKVSNCSLQLQ